jgi:PAS domain S-box-containing protein
MSRDRHISRLVAALVVVALAAGVTTFATVGSVLQTMKRERTEAALSHKHLRERSDALLKLAARIREASQFQLQSDQQVPAAADDLKVLVDSELSSGHERGIQGALVPILSDAAALSDLLKRGAAWQTRWRSVVDDEQNQRSAGAARDRIQLLRREVQGIASRNRLATTARAIRWAESPQSRIHDADARPSLFDAMLQNQELDGLSADLTELARLVEVLNGEPSLDRLDELVNNDLLPTLRNIEHTVDRLVDQHATAGELHPASVHAIGDAIFGAGYVTHPLYKTLSPGSGGLLPLRRESLELQRELALLQSLRDTLTERLDEHAAAFTVASEELNNSLVLEAEASLTHGWWLSTGVATLCGVLFVWLAWLINRGIRRQVAEVERNAVELARQIGQREAAERSVKTLMHTQETILNTIGEGIYWIDVEGKIRFANPAAATLLGWTPAEMIGKSAHALMHHTHVDGSAYPVAACPVYAMLRDGTPRRLDNEVFWRKDGTPFAVEYASTPVFDEAGSISGAVVVFTNIADRKAIEAQQVQAQRLESIGQLAAGIAHEINTPTQYVSDNVVFLQSHFEHLLRVVDHYAKTLEGLALPWDERKAQTAALLEQLDYDFLRREIPLAIGQSLEGLDRVSTIVRAMKDFSHPGSDQKEATDLNRSIRSTVEVCRARWKYVADVELDLDEKLPQVECLIADFNQVILNLVVNAADAIGEKLVGSPDARGRIRISTRRADAQHVEIRVSDDGGGIPKAVQSHIFEQFFTTKPVGRGTGQGLAFSRRVVVDRHAGRIHFETEEGVGTTFVIQLPVSAQSREERQAA